MCVVKPLAHSQTQLLSSNTLLDMFSPVPGHRPAPAFRSNVAASPPHTMVALAARPGGPPTPRATEQTAAPAATLDMAPGTSYIGRVRRTSGVQSSTQRGTLVSPRVHDTFMREWMEELEAPPVTSHTDQILAMWKIRNAFHTSPLVRSRNAPDMWGGSDDERDQESGDEDKHVAHHEIPPHTESNDEGCLGDVSSPPGGAREPVGATQKFSASIFCTAAATRPTCNDEHSGGTSSGQQYDRDHKLRVPSDIATQLAAQTTAKIESSSKRVTQSSQSNARRVVPSLKVGQLVRKEAEREHDVKGAMLPLNFKLLSGSDLLAKHRSLSPVADNEPRDANPVQAAGIRDLRDFDSPVHVSSSAPLAQANGNLLSPLALGQNPKPCWVPLSARGTSWTGGTNLRNTWDEVQSSPTVTLHTPRWDKFPTLTPRDRENSNLRWTAAKHLQAPLRRILQQHTFARLKAENLGNEEMGRCVFEFGESV